MSEAISGTTPLPHIDFLMRATMPDLA